MKKLFVCLMIHTRAAAKRYYGRPKNQLKIKKNEPISKMSTAATAAILRK